MTGVTVTQGCSTWIVQLGLPGMDCPLVSHLDGRLLASQVGGCWWLMRMARDDDATTRAAAWRMLSLLIQPDAQPTRRMLLKACPDVATTALKVDKRQKQSCCTVASFLLMFW